MTNVAFNSVETRSPLARWFTFNVVGAAGVLVQLGVLAALTAAGIPVIPATIVAVEVTVLHNFWWHERYTWRDRPAPTPAARWSRLVRFHALNGAISLVGNVVITTALVEAAGLQPVLANLIAIAACSLVNYVAGDALVFRRSAALVLGAATLGGATLAAQSANALGGWDRYVASVEKRHADAAGPFFALDVRQQAGWRDRARGGQVPMTEVEPPGIPDAKMHHWAGAIYIPRTTVDAVVTKMQEYAGRESEFYEEVKASRLIERQNNRVRVYMRLFRDAGPVEATYNTEHAVEYRKVNATRWTSRSVSTKIAELADAGTPREREKKPGDDSGFLWRLNAYWRFEQVGDGVYVECESVSLSRGVPFLLRPIATPIVNRIARESLERTLRSLRTFLNR